MNVSSKHGGGLTLMRILGGDLDEFDFFISPVEYPVRGFDTISQVKERELNLWENPGDFSPRPMPKRFSADYIKNQIRRVLRFPNPKFINWDYYRKYYTDHLSKNLDLTNGRFLVVPQNIHSVILSNQLFLHAGIRYATWVMDDNILRYDPAGRTFHYPYPKDYQRQFKFHLQNAKHVFVISENMGRFYREKFGVDSTVLFSPSDHSGDISARESNYGLPIRLCHFGRVWEWPLDAVELFAARLEELEATLDIYSHYPLKGALKDNRRVSIREPVEGFQVKKAMAGYDAVTIFYGFSDAVRPWSQLNISTKMSESLASGLPAVFVGPEWGAMSDWVKKHQCGILITDPRSPAQMQQITKLRDSKFREDALRNCIAASEKYTSVRAMRKVWQEGWDKV